MFLFLLVRMFGTVSTKLESSVFFCALLLIHVNGYDNKTKKTRNISKCKVCGRRPTLDRAPLEEMHRIMGEMETGFYLVESACEINN